MQHIVFGLAEPALAVLRMQALAVADKKVSKRSRKQQLKDKKLSSKSLWQNKKRQ